LIYCTDAIIHSSCKFRGENSHDGKSVHMDVDVVQKYNDWLALVLAKGIGPSTCNKLLTEFKNPQSILESSRSRLRSSGLSDASIQSLLFPNTEKINKILDWLDKPHRHLITIFDDDYPELLKSIHSAPVILYAVGQREVLGSLHFAIVGSRNPSTSGRKMAEEFAAELSASGLTVCSGLALGIDYHSHLGALNSGSATVAVLGNGLNTIYPARHKNIASQIVENGLLLSEYPPGTKPNPGNFPQRNRIISGMSSGVLVVEAAKRSGSLITANYAIEQGRDVFAIPGSIHNPLARGTHSLIKQGAKLVETVDDIIEELAPILSLVIDKRSFPVISKKMESELADDYKLLLNSMGYDGVTVDSLVELSGLTAEVVSSMLLILELEGMVESQQGGRYCRCS
jgi:DNA processing protein